ncbi:MAG: thioredoxin-disulfide reductase [Candidatus Nanoarchaeia archaeon]
MENVVILGTGCAGGTAAVYTARADLKPIVYEGNEPGGQLTLTTEVENFPGFPEGIQGPQLVEQIKKQAQRFGADFRYGRATALKQIEGGFEITIDNKEQIQTKTVIIATGASARWLGIPSEEKFKGRGVSTCATCDAFFYKDKPEVIVVGGGDSACEEALVLAKFAKHVTIVVRRDEMRASKIMQERVKKHESIDIMWDTVVDEVTGDKLVEGVKLKNAKPNEIKDHPCNGVFLAIGHIPNTKFLEGLVDVDDHGFIKANFTKTNIPGIFAAGDVQDPVYKQAITAAGSGCHAAMEAEKYLEQ